MKAGIRKNKTIQSLEMGYYTSCSVFILSGHNFSTPLSIWYCVEAERPDTGSTGCLGLKSGFAFAVSWNSLFGLEM